MRWQRQICSDWRLLLATKLLLVLLASWAPSLHAEKSAPPHPLALATQIQKIIRRHGLKTLCATPLFPNPRSTSATNATPQMIPARPWVHYEVGVTTLPFSTLNGVNLGRLFFDGGDWPENPGTPDSDDGLADGNLPPGNDDFNQPIDEVTGEIYDIDNNGHYPPAVLRAIGKHCLVFVPVHLFPTLPRPLSPREEATPEAPALTRLIWPDSPFSLGKQFYWSPQIGGPEATIEPRFLFGFTPEKSYSAIQLLADEFDGRIHSLVSSHFGETEDIDGEEKIFIFLDDVREQGIAGLFNPEDCESRLLYPFSNEKELVYLDAFPYYAFQRELSMGTLCHEYVHLVNYFTNGRKMEERWINEGMAEFSEYLFTDKKLHSELVDYFIANPRISLVSDKSEDFFGPDGLAHYGAGYLFCLYLYEKVGGREGAKLLKKIFADPDPGISGLNRPLQEYQTTFGEIFRDWMVANHVDYYFGIDGTPFRGGIYGYRDNHDDRKENDIGQGEKLPIAPQGHFIANPASLPTIDGLIAPTGGRAFSFTGESADLHFGFDGTDPIAWGIGRVRLSTTIDPAIDFITPTVPARTAAFSLSSFGAGNIYDRALILPYIPEPNRDESVPLSSQTPILIGEHPLPYFALTTNFDQLSIAILPNPVLPGFLDAIVRSHVELGSPPTLSLRGTTGGRPIPVHPLPGGLFLGRFEMGPAESFQLVAEGQDKSGFPIKGSRTIDPAEFAMDF